MANNDESYQVRMGGVADCVSDLSALYQRMFRLSRRLEEIRRFLGTYWQDERYLKYTRAYDDGLDHLDGLKVAVDAVQTLLEDVGTEYSAAENDLISKIRQGGK